MGRPVGGLITQQCPSPPHRCGLRGGESEGVATSPGWDSVPGLDAQQVGVLQSVGTRGVFWQHPSLPVCNVYSLHYGGDVEADGNCLFTAVQRALQLKNTPAEIRQQTVQRFMAVYEASDAPQREKVDRLIRNLYSPDMSSGWGVHVVQEMKLLVKKADRATLASEIEEMTEVDMTRELAIESVYKERCIRIDNASSWSKYMSISGQATDEYDIVTFLYTEEGLLSVEMNAEGTAAAFGDDIAIEALASEFERQVFVVQVHGRDVSTGAENAEGLLFFLPHTPQQEISHPPVFLLMRGTGWCGAGGDHYEPILAKALPVASKEKAAFVL